MKHTDTRSKVLSKIEESSSKGFITAMILSTLAVYLIVSWIVILIDLIVYNAVTGSISFLGFIKYFVSSSLITFIPISVFSIIFVLKLTSPIVKLMTAKEAGKSVSNEEFYMARKRTDNIPVLIFIANIAIPIAINIIQLILSDGNNHEGIWGTIRTVSVFMLGTQAQNAIYQRLLVRPRALLKTYSIEEGKKNLATKYIDRLGFYISAFFLCAVMTYASITLFDTMTDINAESATEESSLLKSDSLAQIRESMEKELSIGKGAALQENASGLTDRLISSFIALIILSIASISVVEAITYHSKHIQVKLLQDILEKLACGSGDLTHRVVILQTDDTGILSYRLNMLLDKLQSMFRNISNQTILVSESSQQVTNVLEETVAATEEMVASVSQINSNTQKTQKIILTCEDSLNLMLKSLEEINSHVSTQAAYVEQTSSALTEMVSNIQSVNVVTSRANELSETLKTVSDKGGQEVLNSIEAVKEIEKSSNEVNNLIQIISKILAATNMLAMNAAIEAAHAGDAGRGFAVVAEEVRNLADDSSKNLKTISTNIKDVLEKVEHGVERSETAGSALNEVGEKTEQTTRLINEVALAMREQSAGANEVLNSINSLVEASESITKLSEEQEKNNNTMKNNLEQTINAFSEVQSATSELETGNKDILGGIEELKQVIQKNNDVVASLKKEIEGFKI